ncbi:hypothetical protein Pmani_036399 [Petrolisthes manimaculis]|uniref:Receptor ligand binding region domain-containing protein n=1 Tax=Petrolisthes manimaculis TaxID=1843537 RepID=A0AAE1TPF6_9EUCA|nr:hypothetical protein Pmani_036399 [Petrolisthes manimaculis]
MLRDVKRNRDQFLSASVPAQSALIYDAVRVVAEALTRLMRKKAEQFGDGPGLGSARMISCNTDVSDKSIWEHGEKITRHMRKVEMEGLTGQHQLHRRGQEEALQY